VLPYHPRSHNSALGTRIIPHVLHTQTWKPSAESRTIPHRVFSKLSRQDGSRNKTPRIVPTIHCPEKVSPGQTIPIFISLLNSHDPFNIETKCENQCELDSMTVSIGTHTTSMCEQSGTYLEDTMSKYVTCARKSNMDRPISFGERVKLTNNLRLVDDIESVPSFETYTITRRYDLRIVVGIKYEGRPFTIRCTTTLQILPHEPRELIIPVHNNCDIEVDPLPLYVSRESSRERAPDYYSIS
jgi:hypothetical protein